MLLDGAMGTELRRRSYSLRAPLFASAAILDAPALVRQIHVDYLREGARALTTNTFMLGAEGTPTQEFAALAHTGVRLAREAITEVEAEAEALVLGNLGPHEAMGDEDLRALADALVSAGADVLLIETATSHKWCARALGVCQGRGLPVWLSCAWSGGRLLNDETADSSLAGLRKLRPPDLLAANCFELRQLDATLQTLQATAKAWGVRDLGVWPNLSRTSSDPTPDFEAVAHSDAQFAQRLVHATAHIEGLELVGSCCGSTPATTAKLALELGKTSRS